MKTLIAYYSLTSNNELLAKYLQKKLNCDLLKIQEINSRNEFTILTDILFHRHPDIEPCNMPVEQYDHVILISTLWGPNVASPMKTFLLQQKENIKSYSFINICGELEAQRAVTARQLSEILGFKPEIVMELHIKDLFPEGETEEDKYASGYTLRPHELNAFDPKIIYYLKFIRAGIPVAC